MSRHLLRFKGAMNPLEDFTGGSTFRLVIGDTAERASNDSVKCVVLRAGQIYYDLEAGHVERKLEDDVTIIRVEQLYPSPYEEVRAELAKYPSAESVVWVQEEPRNQGTFYQVRHYIGDVISEE